MNMIPFNSSTLPAHIQAGSAIANPFAAIASTGYGVLSIKGKVFAVKRSGEVTRLNTPGTNAPAQAINVIIVGGGTHLSKTYYATGYAEGGDDKPTCYSSDGVAPAADAAEPQANKCALCPHAAWGSKITDGGKQGKACQDNARLAVVSPDALDDPLLLRVPPASLKALAAHGSVLARRGVAPHQVVTELTFDYDQPSPVLMFSPVGFVTDDMLPAILDTANGDVVRSITTGGGVMSAGSAETAANPMPTAAAAPAAAAPAKPKATKPKAAAPAAPAAPAATAVEPAVAVAPATQDILNALDELEFDDA